MRKKKRRWNETKQKKIEKKTKLCVCVRCTRVHRHSTADDTSLKSMSMNTKCVQTTNENIHPTLHASNTKYLYLFCYLFRSLFGTVTDTHAHENTFLVDCLSVALLIVQAQCYILLLLAFLCVRAHIHNIQHLLDSPFFRCVFTFLMSRSIENICLKCIQAGPRCEENEQHKKPLFLSPSLFGRSRRVLI